MPLSFALLCLVIQANAPADEAETIYLGSHIVTIDDRRPTAEALAVKAGRILAVGDRLEVLRHRGASTRVVELGERALLPGFLDAHSHYFFSLLVAHQCPLFAPPSGPGKDVPAIIAELKKFAEERKVPKGAEIVGYGYDDSLMPAGRTLNRADLDAAFPDNPVRVDHVSMHGTVLNRLALRKYGFSATTKTPPGGVIVREPGSNEPYGLIMETAFLPVLAQATEPTPEQEREWTRAGQRIYARSGITTAHEGATQLSHFRTMKHAADAGENLIDVVAYPFITDVDAIVAELPVAEWGKYRNRLKVGGVKITIDGSPQGRTAFFTTPYLTSGPGGENPWYGELTFPQETITAMVRKVYAMGVPLNLHANGDAAIDAFLRAHETVAGEDRERPRNTTLLHAQFAREDQIRALAKYRVRPSFYTLHTYYFAAAHIKNRGERQAMRISPMRTAIDAGLHPTNHTDFVVAPLDPTFMLWSAVNRISREGREIGPGERVTPLEGLKAMTIWTAEQYGEEASKGSLEPGKLADLVILSADPLTVPPRKIQEIRVLETIKEGTTIHSAN
jgi:predicted amidohydrolase YtcJ